MLREEHVPDDSSPVSLSLLQAALGYQRIGWCILPVRNDPNTGRKKAACRWRQFRFRSPNPDELKRLFQRTKTLTGLAVILGRRHETDLCPAGYNSVS